MNLNEGVEVWLRSFLTSALGAGELLDYAAPHCTQGKRVIQLPCDTLSIRSDQGYEPNKLRIAKFEAHTQQVAYVFTFRQQITMFVDVCILRIEF